MTTNEIAIVRPSGRLDAAGAPPLEEDLRQHVALGHTRVLVDLAQVRYISSNGLRVLLSARKSVKRSGGAFKLCCLNARLIEIFGMAGLDQVFEIYPTRAEAEAAFEVES